MRGVRDEDRSVPNTEREPLGPINVVCSALTIGPVLVGASDSVGTSIGRVVASTASFTRAAPFTLTGTDESAYATRWTSLQAITFHRAVRLLTA